MPLASKLVFGDQLQIRLDPSKLEAKNRGEWAQIYLSHQAQRAKLFSKAMMWGGASFASAVFALSMGSFFLFVSLVLGVVASKAFYDFGYKKGILDDWDSKIMIRIDK